MFKIDIDENLHIELLNHIHAQELFEVSNKNKEHLKEWLPWAESTTKVEDTQKFITFSLKNYADNGSIEAPIFYNGKIVGMISLRIYKRLNLKRGEIGYWLDYEHQGNGIISKCATKMLEIGFEKYNLKKIIIQCATDNISSNNVAKRLKLKCDGTLRCDAMVGKKIEDINIYSMLKEEYENEYN